MLIPVFLAYFTQKMKPVLLLIGSRLTRRVAHQLEGGRDGGTW